MSRLDWHGNVEPFFEGTLRCLLEEQACERDFKDYRDIRKYLNEPFVVDPSFNKEIRREIALARAECGKIDGLLQVVPDYEPYLKAPTQHHGVKHAKDPVRDYLEKAPVLTAVELSKRARAIWLRECGKDKGPNGCTAVDVAVEYCKRQGFPVYASAVRRAISSKRSSD